MLGGNPRGGLSRRLQRFDEDERLCRGKRDAPRRGGTTLGTLGPGGAEEHVLHFILDGLYIAEGLRQRAGRGGREEMELVTNDAHLAIYAVARLHSD